MLHPYTPQALGYIGVRAGEVGEWAGYATSLLGMQVVDKTSRRLALRMDDRKQRVIVDVDPANGKGIGYYGWEMPSAAALDRLCAHLDTSGIKFARGSKSLAAERMVADLITLNDPVGNRIEFFHTPEVTADPFEPSRNISGFRTGPLGVGHVVMMVDSVKEAIPFYRDILGFGVSDYYDKPFTACFFHVNPRHHSFALIETGEKKVHHMMVELFSFDDVGQGYDIAQLDESKIAVTLGRHAGDYMTSFYTWNPSAFMMEYGWGGRAIDPATWTPSERKEGPSLWGHKRMWLPEEERAKAQAHTLKNGADGVRRPVQVMDGNYTLMPGTCPWWDRTIARTA
ncbi:MAG: VOC family protein [Hyphomicrobiaceae bacterium]